MRKIPVILISLMLILLTATIAIAISNDEIPLLGGVCWSDDAGISSAKLIGYGFHQTPLWFQDIYAFDSGKVIGYDISTMNMITEAKFPIGYEIEFKSQYRDGIYEKLVEEYGEPYEGTHDWQEPLFGTTNTYDALCWDTPNTIICLYSMPHKSLTTCLSLYKAKKNIDFSIRNNITFGLTRNEIIKLEGKDPDVEQDGDIGFTTKTAGLDAAVIFYFDESDRLYEIIYYFLDEHTNANQYLSDYSLIQKSLSEKYDMPNSDKEVWLSDTYRNQPQKKGYAISVGDLKIGSEWHYQDVVIKHLLYGDNYEIQHTIIYENPLVRTSNTDGL